ncbi:MAG: class I SAM-dependent methyltransferase [Gammaproteobacteria bacterium]
MSVDPWLDRWFDELGRMSGSLDVLELGCGPGRDTVLLAEKGHQLVAADVDEVALRRCAERVPTAHPVLLDLAAALPFLDEAFDAVIASLCLHYFDWPATQRAMGEIHRCLRMDGCLAVRVNSTKDVNHGAVGHPEIAHLFYDVNGRRKRFFDRASIEKLFAQGWRCDSVTEMTIERWALPKVVWEVFATRR